MISQNSSRAYAFKSRALDTPQWQNKPKTTGKERKKDTEANRNQHRKQIEKILNLILN